jgi:hypothetical protein
VADPIVEGLSNAGFFGPGRFTDHSTSDVAPALGVGLAFASLYVRVLIRRALSRPGRPREWMRASNAALKSTGLVRMFPATFVLQIAALFAMESVEQLLVAGHLMGGTVWLGGPVALSLGFHAIVGLVVAAVFMRVLHQVAETIAEAITLLRRLVLAWSALTPAAPIAVLGDLIRRCDEPALARLPSRGPPTRTF